ncbi:MAG: DUF2066 domain-containing protein [Alphaproteobacteria bacterium]|nr:DUF2066 domain-containing protein [Alphaproteobacteria bacterium]
MMKNLCLIGLILGMGMSVARADLYRVSGIPISAELSSAKEARAAAITNGETDAFWALMKKMVSPDNQQQIPMPPEADIHAWVQTVSLANEKNTATKYMADLGVRFDETKIQDFLTQNNIPFLTKDLPDTVIVPVYQVGENVWTVEEQNPLYTYLKGNPPKNELWKTVLPVGELEEIVAIREAIGNENRGALNGLTGRYDVESVMVVKINQRGPYVTADVSYVPAQPALDNRVDVVASNGQITSVIPALWGKVVRAQEQKWRDLKTQNFESQMTFWAQIPIRKLSEWTPLYQKLKKADFLNGFTVRGFRPNEVWVTFGYKGTSADLNRQLRPLGLSLMVGDQNGFWVIKPRGGFEE